MLGSNAALPEKDEDIMVAVIAKRDPNFKKDGLEYPLRARFDAEMAQIALSGLADVQSATRKDAAGAKSSVDLAREAMIEKNRNAWKDKA